MHKFFGSVFRSDRHDDTMTRHDSPCTCLHVLITKVETKFVWSISYFDYEHYQMWRVGQFGALFATKSAE